MVLHISEPLSGLETSDTTLKSHNAVALFPVHFPHYVTSDVALYGDGGPLTTDRRGNPAKLHSETS